MKPVIVWFRRDLRLADNPALAAAAASGAPVMPVFVLDDETPGAWRAGGASRWWLHHSLAALEKSLAGRAPLVLRRGRAAAVIPALAREIGAGRVVWNRAYEPHAVARDTALKAALQGEGIAAESFNAALLFEPWTVLTGAGTPYKVFTPFWNACRAAPAQPAPMPAPKAVRALDRPPPSEALADWRLVPTAPDWAGGFRDTWRPGEAAAGAALAEFLDRAAAGYDGARDRPDLAATSRLSPHLAFGEIGPRQIWHATRARFDGAGDRGRETFLKELAWREFSYHLLYHWPTLPEAPFRTEFAAFPWRDDAASVAAWRTGRTGYPLVDAGMRQLWRTGWMHNRVRMVAASFLVKHLLAPWQRGAAWFWDTLVDADLASNSASWQWVAGSGADAAPYFRIFNPVAQGERFDPAGDYVRAHVPELARLPAAWIHRPFAAPAPVLAAAGIRLGENYPRPIVDHAAARARALAAYAGLKNRGEPETTASAAVRL
jgi:deoxyribodipyrimidine photo-lyase